MMTNYKVSLPQVQIMQSFAFYDVDGSGSLDFEDSLYTM